MDLQTLAHELTWLKNNFKQYIAGQTYNGVALTVSTGAAGFSLIRGTFRPYRFLTGQYFLDFYFAFTLNSTGTNTTLAVTGVTNLNITNVRQPFVINSSSAAGGAYSLGSTRNSGIADPNTGDFRFIWAYGDTIDAIGRGTVELNSWPTWADDII